MKKRLIASLLALSLVEPALAAEDCTPEQAEDMSNELSDAAMERIHNYLISASLVRLQKDKIGAVLVAHPVELPDKLKPLVKDLNQLKELVKQKSAKACDESERLREKYRI